MQKWEYNVSVVNRNSISKKLEDLGRDGWELVDVIHANYDITLFLKRKTDNRALSKKQREEAIADIKAEKGLSTDKEEKPKKKGWFSK